MTLGVYQAPSLQIRSSPAAISSAYTAYTEMVIQAVKWPNRAAHQCASAAGQSFAQFSNGPPASKADGCEGKQGGDQECAQKYFRLGSHWHLGASHHLLPQGSKFANPACRWIDILKSLNLGDIDSMVLCGCHEDRAHALSKDS